MPEHEQPEPEDQGFTSPDLGGEQEEAKAGDEGSIQERMKDYESIVELGDLKQIKGKIEFYGALIDGNEELQQPLRESQLPPEVIQAIENQREVWKAAQEATQRNVDIIKQHIGS